MTTKTAVRRSSSCSCVNLRRAARSLTELYDDSLEPCGLNVCQYSLLSAVNRLERANVSAIAREVHLDRTTVVRNLARLEKKRLIADEALPGERDRKLGLTEKGAKTLESAAELWRGAQQWLEKKLGRDDLELLTGLLLRIEELGKSKSADGNRRLYYAVTQKRKKGSS